MPDKQFIVSKKCIANDYVYITAKSKKDAIRQVEEGHGKTMRDSVEFVSYTNDIPWGAEDITHQTELLPEYQEWLKSQNLK